MTTSKRTTRGAGGRPDNGAATPNTPAQSAPVENTPRQSAAAPSAAPAGASPPKVRVRQRKPASRLSASSPASANASSAGASDATASHAASVKAPHSSVDRYASIAQAAYFRSQHRGFKPGHEMEDWLAAEAEVDQRLRGQSRIAGD
jgi:hypothetical protein